MAKEARRIRPGAEAEEALVAWMGRHRKVLGWVGVVIVVGVGVAWWSVAAGQRKEVAAEQMLETARLELEQGDLARAAAGMNRVIDEFRGTNAAHTAVLLLNEIRLSQGQATLAAQDLERYAADAPRSRRAEVYLLLGAAWEDAGEPARAAQSYVRGAEAARWDYQAAEALLDAGRAHLASGDTGAAEIVYRRVVDEYAETDQVVEARVRLAEVAGSPARM